MKRLYATALKKTAVSLSTLFAASTISAVEAAPAPLPPAPAVPAPAASAADPQPKEGPTISGDYSFWKTEFFDSVIALKKCPETGVCGYVHWLNPKDEKIFNYFGDPGVKAQKAMTRTEFFGESVTEDDVRALCGFSPRLSFKKVADNHWTGSMETRGYNMSVDVDVTITDPGRMTVITSKGPFKQKETWVRVAEGDPRYPKCAAPSKRK